VQVETISLAARDRSQMDSGRTHTHIQYHISASHFVQTWPKPLPNFNFADEW